MTSSKQQIAQAAGIVIIAFALSRILGLAREMIIGQQFGTSGELDAYLAAFRLPDLLFQLVAGGALGSAFIPTFSGHLALGDERGAWRLASAVTNWVLVLLSALALLAAVFAPWLVGRVIAPGFAPAKRALTVQLMRLMLLSPILFGVSGIVMGVLNSYQHFLLPALAPIIYNLSIIGAALFLSPLWRIHSLAVGVVVGSLLHLAVQVPGLVRKGLRYSPILGLGDPSVREVGRLMAPRVLGLAVVQLNFLVNTILASGLADGSLAALNFAWLLMLLPQGIFAQALATAAFPTFSELAAKRQIVEMRSTLSATLRAILYLAIPASVGLVTLRYPIVQLLFQRGAFKQSSTEAVVWALQFYALGLLAHAVVEIVTRAFYALHDTLTPVLIGVGAMSINVVLSLILIRPLAHGGLALANSTATFLEMGGLLWVIQRRLEGLEGSRLLDFTLRTVLAAGLMGLGVSCFAARMPGQSPIIVGGGGIVLGGLIYFLMTLVLGWREVRALWQRKSPLPNLLSCKFVLRRYQPMKRKIVSTDKAPAAVGPYSQAVRVGDFVFAAGQVAIDPAAGRLIEGDVAAQTRQALTNLSAVLEAAGSSLSSVVKTTVFLKDMGQFQAMNAVYAEFFPSDPPARSTIAVAALPLGALVEIEAIAVAG